MCKWIRIMTLCPGCFKRTHVKKASTSADKHDRPVLFDGEVHDGNVLDICDEAREHRDVCDHITQPRVLKHNFDRLDVFEQQNRMNTRRRMWEARNPAPLQLNAFNFNVVGTTICEDCIDTRAPKDDETSVDEEEGVLLALENEYVQAQWKSKLFQRHHKTCERELLALPESPVAKFGSQDSEWDLAMAHVTNLIRKMAAHAFVMHYPGHFNARNMFTDWMYVMDGEFRAQMPQLLYKVLRINAASPNDVFQLEFLEELFSREPFHQRVQCHTIADKTIPSRTVADMDPAVAFSEYCGLGGRLNESVGMLTASARAYYKPPQDSREADMYEARTIARQKANKTARNVRLIGLRILQEYIRDSVIGDKLYGWGSDLPAKANLLPRVDPDITGGGNTWGTRPGWLELWPGMHKPGHQWPVEPVRIRNGSPIDLDSTAHGTSRKVVRFADVVVKQDKPEERKLSDPDKSKYHANPVVRPRTTCMVNTAKRKHGSRDTSPFSSNMEPAYPWRVKPSCGRADTSRSTRVGASENEHQERNSTRRAERQHVEDSSESNYANTRTADLDVG